MNLELHRQRLDRAVVLAKCVQMRIRHRDRAARGQHGTPDICQRVSALLLGFGDASGARRELFLERAARGVLLPL